MIPVDFKSCRKGPRKKLGTRAQKANYERSADTETCIDSRLHSGSVPRSVTVVLLHSGFLHQANGEVLKSISSRKCNVNVPEKQAVGAP
jgi:hypothetical protein